MILDTGPIPGGSGIPEEEDQDNSGATTGNTSSKTSFNPPVSSNTGLTGTRQNRVLISGRIAHKHISLSDIMFER